MSNSYYLPEYDDSYALIIGINDYVNASPLSFAVNDAKAIADLLKSEFDFKSQNIKILLNEEDTKSEIMSNFMSYASSGISENDRIIIFFAGHGSTETGNRGEVGFLIPHDGDKENLSTLIRWDELTRNSELIKAKHILFIMDACYGGLAITRSLPAGSMRFLKDMLQRFSHQVLTAGKADEVVSDAGGPIPEHSVFTGHLLEGLQGKAATKEGVITANGIMAYVYDRVSKDINSNQTPHYGFLEGDGDFIFQAPNLEKFKEKEEVDEDILIPIPTSLTKINETEFNNLIDQTKEFISNDRFKIKLHDLFSQKIREVVSQLSDDRFIAEGINYSDEELIERIKLYENIVNEIQQMISCVAYWGDKKHYELLSKTIVRICDHIIPKPGTTIWLDLRWYPIFLLFYSAGISAIAAKNYNALLTLLTTKVHSINNAYDIREITIHLGLATQDLTRVFKRLPGHEKHYVARSEYLFKLLQPSLDDLLFLGSDYESIFDRFEIFFALEYVDLIYKPPKETHIWGPPGRFSYKSRPLGTDNPYKKIINDAENLKFEWPPLKAGFFSGSFDRFIEISEKSKLLLRI